MKITKVREQTLEMGVPVRGRCPACGCEVEVVTPAQAGDLLEMGKETLGALLSAGKVHAIEGGSGSEGVCKDSLFLHRLRNAVAAKE